MNPAIDNRSGTLDESFFARPFEVECDGPPEELAILGGICGMGTRYDLLSWPTDGEHGQGTWIGPLDGPFFMIFAELPGEPRMGQDIAGDLQYAAFVVRQSKGDDVADTLNQWAVGEPVRSGSVTTYRYAPRTCNDNWYADGTFVWRSTTLKFPWVAATGC